MGYLARVARPLVVCALGILPFVGATSILTFSDRSCSTLRNTINVKDATGSGECMKITSGFTSFMIGTLGDGCSVTIYGDDPKDPICSATNNTIAEPLVCYNSTWAYFSVDLCSPRSSSLTTSTSTSTSSATATTTMTTPTTASESSSNNVNVGAVVGGTISGVFVLAIIAGAGLYFFWFRPRQQRQMAELPAHSATSPGGGENEAYMMKDYYAKSNQYKPLPEEPQPVHELSPQYIAEVHEQTHERHELPP
ncbi:hypothetical protein F5B22DRAFT_563144 [Xylaria bambusicola]|uniref:uncharacterized protein n=1 Tax=Xylaria bambusicola TaxID=326684 RepID=UPI002008AEE4|nr:uncharacterized protein F5B22DRAFT_563144 [Xylaria bambusicola]KAI0503155.1 hypothetical protein F5B22DRAFT_563144 [Xylaria bambusicola]